MFTVGYADSPVIPEEPILQTARQSAAAAAKPASPAVQPKQAKPTSTQTMTPPPQSPKPQPATPASLPPQTWVIRDLYVNPSTDAANQARLWAASRPADAAVMARIASQPQAMWYDGWSTNLQADVSAYVGQAAAANKMPVLVAYNIPARDCGQYSAGGATGATEYAAWIQRMVNGIAGRPAVVILEPDALPMLTTCLDAAGQQARLQMLQQAVAAFKSSRTTYVYIDAGNAGWVPAATMAGRLQQAGIGQADGFSLNVSNFYTTSQSVGYGTQLSGLVGGKHFVIDTSRNGNGAKSGGEWCNPDGRALGTTPTAIPSVSPLVDALLWVKIPGQSDGDCNGGPAAGEWWPDYALGLARSAGW